jgi:hypothetical protein
MGDKDIVSKEIIKEIGRDISMHILGIDIQGEVTLVDKEWTRVEKRDSDIVFKNGNRIIHIEIQNSHHSNMELRMLRYYSDILFEYKDCTVSQYLIYIGKDRCYMKSKIVRDEISYKYGIIDMKDVACEDLLYHDHPSAVALSILCDFKDKDKQTVVNTILRRLRELTDGDELEYGNYVKKVSILSTNRDLENEIKKGMNMLTIKLQDTPVYQWEMKQTQFKDAVIMIEKFKLSIDDIVKELNIKKEELLEYMKNMKEEK